MRAEGTCLLVIHDGVVRELVIRSDVISGGSILSDDEVLTVARSASRAILRVGGVSGLGLQAQLVSNELQNAATSGKSKSQSVCSLSQGIGVVFAREWNRETLLHREFETSDCEVDWETDSVRV
jgi:hypothetical protein